MLKKSLLILDALVIITQTLNNMRDIGQLLNLIKYSPITEKTVNLKEIGQHVFVLDRSLNKGEIRNIIEKTFCVNVLSVNTCILPLKTKRVRKFFGTKPRFKKAYVTLGLKTNKLKKLSTNL